MAGMCVALDPPSVPNNTARLRVTVKWVNTDQQLAQFANDFARVVAEFRS